jgi:hypothetical protein
MAVSYARRRRSNASREKTAICKALKSQDTLGAWNIVAAGPLDGLSNSQSQSLERRFGAAKNSGQLERVNQGELYTYMWWLFSPRIQSTWSVTPAAKANDWSKWGIISVETLAMGLT